MELPNRNILICCPQRWWFRYIFYIQLIILPQLLEWNDFILPIIITGAYYISRMPSICILDDGIELNIFGYRRLIKWENIKRVRMTSKKIVIGEYWFFFPIYIFYWRKNFKETQEILEAKLGEKVIWFPFPLPI